MAEKYKDLKEFLAFGLPFAMVVDDKLQDGFQWTDMFAFIPVMTTLPAAIEGMENIVDEIAGLDDEGRLELSKYIIETFNIKDDFAEELVEQGLRTGLELVKTVTLLRKMRNPK